MKIVAEDVKFEIEEEFSDSSSLCVNLTRHGLTIASLSLNILDEGISIDIYDTDENELAGLWYTYGELSGDDV